MSEVPLQASGAFSFKDEANGSNSIWESEVIHYKCHNRQRHLFGYLVAESDLIHARASIENRRFCVQATGKRVLSFFLFFITLEPRVE